MSPSFKACWGEAEWVIQGDEFGGFGSEGFGDMVGEEKSEVMVGRAIGTRFGIILEGRKQVSE